MNPVSLLLAVNFDQKKLLARFWRSASCFWREDRPRAPVLIVFLVGIVLLQLLVQVLLNLWNRHFFDALERRDGQALWFQAGMFFPLAAASILLAATSVWGPMRAQRSWREAATTLRSSTCSNLADGQDRSKWSLRYGTLETQNQLDSA